MSAVHENYQTSLTMNASHKKYFFKDGNLVRKLSLDTIVNGSEKFEGLLSIVKKMLNSSDLSSAQKDSYQVIFFLLSSFECLRKSIDFKIFEALFESCIKSSCWPRPNSSPEDEKICHET